MLAPNLHLSLYDHHLYQILHCQQIEWLNVSDMPKNKLHVTEANLVEYVWQTKLSSILPPLDHLLKV